MKCYWLDDGSVAYLAGIGSYLVVGESVRLTC